MVDLIKSPDDPIWRQYVPTVEELDIRDGIVDSLNEDADSPVPNITHRYPDRALFLVSPGLRQLLPVLHPAAQGGRSREDPDVAVRERLPVPRAAHRDPGRHHVRRRPAAAQRPAARGHPDPAPGHSAPPDHPDREPGTLPPARADHARALRRCSSGSTRCSSTRTSTTPTS